jgi:antitoxin ParD1/3/4
MTLRHLAKNGKDSAMATMNVSLPNQMRDWIESQAANGKYSSSSDYLRELVRKEQERFEYRAWLNTEIEKGYESGFSELTLDEVFAEASRAAEEEDERPETAA